MFEGLMDEAAASQGNKRLQIVQQLASTPDETLKAITSGYQNKSRWRPMMEVLQAIGYPNNATAIRWLVDHVDKNSPAWDETLAVVRLIPPNAIAPYFISVLWPSDRRQSEWGYDVESVCEAINSLGRDYAIPCGPTVAFILNLKVDPVLLDPTYLLDTLQTIGESGAEYAMPALLAFAEATPTNEYRERALQLIATFDRRQVDDYALVLSQTFRDMTSSPDIHNS